LEVAEVAYLRVFGIERTPPEPPRPPPPPPSAGMIGLLNSGAGGDPNAPTAPWGRDDSSDEQGQLERPPSRRWAIAAAARVGLGWAAFVRDFRAVPVPKEWKGHGIVPGTVDLTYEELRDCYDCGSGESPSETWKQRSKSACLLVVRLSSAYHV